MSQCEIDSLPPVGELSHKEGCCYCYLCSCGKHACPSQARYSLPATKRNYHTSYRNDFPQKRFSPPRQFVRDGELRQTRNRMELKTSLQEQFPAYQTPQPTASSREKVVYRPSHFKLAGQSTYKNYYSHWNQYYPPLKPIPLHYSPSPVPFSGSSTYKDAFISKEASVRPSAQAKGTTSTLIGVRNFSSLDTTNQRTYKVHSSLDFPSKVHSKLPETLAFESPRVHYTTTYAENYLNAEARKEVPTRRQAAKAKSLLA